MDTKYSNKNYHIRFFRWREPVLDCERELGGVDEVQRSRIHRDRDLQERTLIDKEESSLLVLLKR